MPTRTGPIALASVASVASPLAMPTRRSACSATMVTLARPAAPSAALRCQTSSANFSSRACVEPKAVGASASACNRNARNRSPSSTLIRRTCQSRDTSRSSSFTGQLRSGGETFRLAARQRQQFRKILGANRQGGAVTTEAWLGNCAEIGGVVTAPDLPHTTKPHALAGGASLQAGRHFQRSGPGSRRCRPLRCSAVRCRLWTARGFPLRSASPRPGRRRRPASDGGGGRGANAGQPTASAGSLHRREGARRHRAGPFQAQAPPSSHLLQAMGMAGIPNRVPPIGLGECDDSSHCLLTPAIRGRAAKVWIDAICCRSA